MNMPSRRLNVCWKVWAKIGEETRNKEAANVRKPGKL